jgi:cytochrome c peroxidase
MPRRGTGPFGLALVVSLALAAIAGVGACRKSESSLASIAARPVGAWSDEELLAEGRRYMDEPDFRRAALVGSLVNTTNTYSRQRLESYGLKTRGWDLLPEWIPQSVPVTKAHAEKLRKHEKLDLDPSTPRLWDGKRPTTSAGWVALGREVFFGYPLRVEVFMNFALQHPDLGERVGVRAGEGGVYPGIRLFTDVRGQTSLGITCAICHANVSDGHVIVGAARRSFDYGALRLAYHEATGAPVDKELARRMHTWGPGRADVTEDDDEDPVAIPDLWGLKHQTALTQAGTLKHTGPAVLAIRQETQLLHSNHQKVRPPRELAFALAMFLYSLEPGEALPRDAAASRDPRLAQGQALFERHCTTCHENPAKGGPPVAAERVGTDRAFANGGARGTGTYRTPALIRVAAAAPYFHDGSVPSLADVLSPERLAPSYARSPVGKGAVPGHAFGTELSVEERDALVVYMRSL